MNPLPAGLELREFDASYANDWELAALAKFINNQRGQISPYQSQKSVADLVAAIRGRPSSLLPYEWLVWRADEIVAGAYLYVWGAGHRQNVTDFWIFVLPELRRQHLGSALLGLIADKAEAEQRELLTVSFNRNHDGRSFVEELGGRSVLTWTLRELRLASVNRVAIDSWLARGEELSSEFDLGIWKGRYPEGELESITELLHVMDSQPRGEMEREDSQHTVQQIREWDASLADRGNVRWTMWLRQKESGRLAGFTEAGWNGGTPDLMEQGDTGVLPEYRNRGLARWLKAAMLLKVMRDRPEVQSISSWNAPINSSMIRINDELGYKVVATSDTWQLTLKQVRTFLARQQ